MRTISFTKEALNITIHNQYPGLELTFPVYFSNGTTCHVSPNQQTSTGTTMEASLGIDSTQEDFKCALLYKLLIKYASRTDDQPNSNTASIDDTAANMYLLVVWDVKDYEHRFYVCLIECINDFTWSEDKLWALYCEYNGRLYEDYKSNLITWSMYGGAVMETRLDVAYEPDYKLSIVISEESGKYNMKDPIKVDPKRLVLSLSMLTVLIYRVSLTTESSFKLNVQNQCLNVDLMSPTYVTGDGLECYRSPEHKVYSGDTMRSSFIIKLSNESNGALVYKLQRKQLYESTEISEDTSSVVHLLVVWEISESGKLYADALLVEHEEGFDWCKDDLKELYSKNINRFRLCPDSATETWLMDDNVAMMMTFKIMNSDCILDIVISDVERDDNTRIPIHIDLKR
jgi:hypothetical protein